MLCRRTQSTLPTSDNLINPQPIDSKVVQEDISAKRRVSRAKYDMSAGLKHKPLPVGDYAYLKPPPNRRGQPWTYGQISRMEGPRSYTKVKPHGQMHRNRVHVRPAAPPPHNYNSRLNAPPRASKFSLGRIGTVRPMGTSQPPDSHLTDVPMHVPIPEVNESRPPCNSRMERAPNQSVPTTPRAMSVPTPSRAQTHSGPESNTAPPASPSKTVLASPTQRGHAGIRMTSPLIIRETRTRRVLPHPKYADYFMG